LDRKLLISASPGEWRAALLEDGVPVELYVERCDRAEAGSIYLGRVLRLLPALDAGLVDIGGNRPAFLPQREVLPRGRRLHEGERLIVQVRREAQGGKAARLTTAVTLRGEFVDLTPGRPGFKRVDVLTPDERQQLFAALKTLSRPAPSRTAGEADRSEAGRGHPGIEIRHSAPAHSLIANVEELARLWDEILKCASRLEPPARLHPAPSFACALCSSIPTAPGDIFTDDPGIIPDVRAAFPRSAISHLRETEWPVDLDAVFSEALSETLILAGGGSVHFEPSRAGMLVDVDTGAPETGSAERSALTTNLAAAQVIGRQVRLRNVSGGIVVDFVGMESRSARDGVCVVLADALGPDPRAPQLLGWTRLGHFELVRPRRGRSLTEALLEPRPNGVLVKTSVTVAHEALRGLRQAAQAQPGRQWRLTAAPDVATALTGVAADAMREAEKRFARGLAIEVDPAYDRERFQISAV
jgi:ribonuclease G